MWVIEPVNHWPLSKSLLLEYDSMSPAAVFNESVARRHAVVPISDSARKKSTGTIKLPAIFRRLFCMLLWNGRPFRLGIEDRRFRGV